MSFLRLFVVCSSHTHTASPTVGHADVTSDVTGASGGTVADVTPRDSDMGSAEPDDDDDGEDEDEDDEDATLRFVFKLEKWRQGRWFGPGPEGLLSRRPGCLIQRHSCAFASQLEQRSRWRFGPGPEGWLSRRLRG